MITTRCRYKTIGGIADGPGEIVPAGSVGAAGVDGERALGKVLFIVVEPANDAFGYICGGGDYNCSCIHERGHGQQDILC